MSFEIDIQKYSEPEIFYRNKKPCYLDRVKKILRPKAPEEIVRQRFISFLMDVMQVPISAIAVEVPLSYYKKGARGRIDIVIHGIDDEGYNIPVMIVECKADGIPLTDRVFRQADNYRKITGAIVVGVTDGTILQFDKWSDELSKYEEISTIPTYDEMCKPQELKTHESESTKFERPSFDKLSSDELYEGALDYAIIGEDTPRKFVPFVLNLYNCLQDDNDVLANLQINGYKFIRDGGMRYTDFGNASGGSYCGFYRFFIIEDNDGNTQICSVTIFGNDGGTTYLCVGIDDEQSHHHHALQLAFDYFADLSQSKATIWHDGRMTVGNIGSVKRDRVISYIETKAPHLVNEKNRIILGEFDCNRDIAINSNETKTFLSNLILYSLLRDEYRAIVKQG